MKKNITKRRENGLLAFSVDLSTVLKSLKKEKVTNTDIKENWTEFCPINYVNVTTPIALKSGTLTIKANSGPIALETSAIKEEIKEKINTFFGKTIVETIKITQ